MPAKKARQIRGNLMQKGSPPDKTGGGSDGDKGLKRSPPDDMDDRENRGDSKESSGEIEGKMSEGGRSDPGVGASALGPDLSGGSHPSKRSRVEPAMGAFQQAPEAQAKRHSPQEAKAKRHQRQRLSGTAPLIFSHASLCLVCHAIRNKGSAEWVVAF